MRQAYGGARPSFKPAGAAAAVRRTPTPDLSHGALVPTLDATPRRIRHGAVSQEVHTACEGGGTPRTQHTAYVQCRALRERTPHRAAVSGGSARGRVRDGLLLG